MALCCWDQDGDGAVIMVVEDEEDDADATDTDAAERVIVVVLRAHTPAAVRPMTRDKKDALFICVAGVA